MRHEVQVGNVYRERNHDAPRTMRVERIETRPRWNQPTLMAWCVPIAPMTDRPRGALGTWLAVDRLEVEQGWKLVSEEPR